MTNRNTALVPTSIKETKALAADFAKSNLLPEKLRENPADVFVCLMAGQEVGLTPMASIRSFDVVEGRPRMNSKAAVALVLASGKAKYFHCVEADHEKATFETWRVGAPEPRRHTFTWEDAKRAGLPDKGSDEKARKKNGWNRHPRSMLVARASGQLAEEVYPDVLRGLMGADPPSAAWEDPEPEADEVAAEPDDVVEAEIVEDEASTAGEATDSDRDRWNERIQGYERRIASATSAAALARMGEGELAKEHHVVRDAVRPSYTKRYQELLAKERRSGQQGLGV